MARASRTIYICRTCHRVGERALTCHPHSSAKCDAGVPGDERSMPLFDAQGRIVTRAPKWWVEACFKAKGKSQNGKRGTLERKTR